MDRAEGEFDASVMAGILADDDDVAEGDEEDDEVVVLEAGQLFEFDEEDAVVERPAPSPVQSPSPVHPADDAGGGYGTGYDSDDFVGRSPVKKLKTDGARAAGGGRAKGATTTK